MSITKKFQGTTNKFVVRIVKKSKITPQKILIGILCIAGFGLFLFSQNIYDFYLNKNQQDNPSTPYHKDDNLYFKTAKSFIVSDKSDFKNIFFTTLNNHWENTTIKCNIEYKNCVDDFEKSLQDNELMTALNDYIHPYRQYQSISYFQTGRIIKMKVTYLYNSNDIKKIEYFFNKLDFKTVDEANIYITNNITYQLGSNNLLIMIDKKQGNCKAISDFINIVLYRIGRNSFTISNDFHAWNAIFENGEILHIDSTWNMKTDNFYFKLTTDEITSLQEKEHKIPSIYKKFYNSVN